MGKARYLIIALLLLPGLAKAEPSVADAFLEMNPFYRLIGSDEVDGVQRHHFISPLPNPVFSRPGGGDYHYVQVMENERLESDVIYSVDCAVAAYHVVPASPLAERVRPQHRMDQALYQLLCSADYSAERAIAAERLAEMAKKGE